MFNVMKDERLKLIQNEGAALAFGVNFIIVMGLMIARGCAYPHPLDKIQGRLS